MHRLLVQIGLCVALLLISQNGYGAAVAGSITFTFSTNQLASSVASGSWQPVVISPDGTKTDGPVVNVNSAQQVFTIVIGSTINTGEVYTVLFRNISINNVVFGAGDLITNLTATSTVTPSDTVQLRAPSSMSILTAGVCGQIGYVPY